MSKSISITLQGEFEEHELFAMVALLRNIDKAHPDRTYELFIHDPENTLQEAEAELKRLLPLASDRETKFTIHRRQ